MCFQEKKNQRVALNLALPCRSSCQSAGKSLTFLRSQLSPLRASTTSISLEYIALEPLFVLGGKLPFLQQVLRKVLFEASDDVLADYG